MDSIELILIVGPVAIIVALIYLVFKVSSHSREKLQTMGVKRQAKIVKIEQYAEIGIIRMLTAGEWNSVRCSYFITCEYTDPATNKVRILKSNSLRFIPIIKIVPGDTKIDVYFDKSNPDKYWVDTSQIKVGGGILGIPPIPLEKMAFMTKSVYYHTFPGAIYQSTDGENYSYVKRWYSPNFFIICGILVLIIIFTVF